MDQRFARGDQRLAKRRLKGLELIWLFLFAFLMALPMLWITSVRARLLDYGYQVQTLRTEADELLQEQDALRAELAYLQRPDLVFQEMLNRGMVPGGRRVAVHSGPEMVVAEGVSRRAQVR